MMRRENRARTAMQRARARSVCECTVMRARACVTPSEEERHRKKARGPCSRRERSSSRCPESHHPRRLAKPSSSKLHTLSRRARTGITGSARSATAPPRSGTFCRRPRGAPKHAADVCVESEASAGGERSRVVCVSIDILPRGWRRGAVSETGVAARQSSAALHRDGRRAN